MSSVLHAVGGYWWVIALIVLVLAHRLLLRPLGVVIIPQNRAGIVNKKYVVVGKNRNLPDGAIIALNGEAGYQADTLAPGLHFGLWPWQYAVELVEFVTVEEGKIGIVEARDGHPLSGGRVLAKHVDSDSFQDARKFLTGSGERGPQISIIPPGTYRINTRLFSVEEVDVLDVPDNMVGIVTTKEGASLKTGEIAGREIAGHNMYQDAQAFVSNGGYKGLQEQPILSGRYFINPRFARVEMKPMTEVAIAHVGVVIAFVGNDGVDVTGDDFKHGNLVSKGQKGVWADPLDPGKYPINPYTHRVEQVPTANVVLNWANDKSESHKLDERLSSITVRSSDGFTFNLDVSQIIHIPRSDAPKVIARFGSVANLVTQVLEPTIGNYFRNAAQDSDVIQFLKQRSQRQEEAKKSIRAALTEYNVGAVDTLIGDIVPPEALMRTLTDRKIAEQQKVTYETQQLAQESRKALEQATAIANTQARVVDAERSVQIAEFSASAAVKTAEGEATSKTINAKADAEVTTLTGKADAGKILAIGNAEAEVIQKKINSVEAGNYAAIEVSRNLANSRVPIVPSIVAGGDGKDGSSGLVNILLANLVAESVKNSAAAPGAALPAVLTTTSETPAPVS
ncbi:MAG: band 7 protein [Parcubacteria group bacterium]|nr:band 7 protein [Parcubacteria group bacterium]